MNQEQKQAIQELRESLQKIGATKTKEEKAKEAHAFIDNIIGREGITDKTRKFLSSLHQLHNPEQILKQIKIFKRNNKLSSEDYIGLQDVYYSTLAIIKGGDSKTYMARREEFEDNRDRREREEMEKNIPLSREELAKKRDWERLQQLKKSGSEQEYWEFKKYFEKRYYPPRFDRSKAWRKPKRSL